MGTKRRGLRMGLEQFWHVGGGGLFFVVVLAVLE